ncbi:MAG: TetR/AcrR family transcriptional regulator [Candidatus Nanopelagicales bacterium]|nr:TetR/AcrR family transcriptional regulator [Candidatus Nanopelagicales bacterium]
MARTRREAAREELTAQILELGRAHLAVEGAAGLSLRAIARDLGMVSSAVYRYVPSRDALLTLLIVDAYDALGAVAETAEARVARADLMGRFVAVAMAVRTWALEHPHEYALIYGSPVPGYAAPEATIGPASRVPTLLLTILAQMPEPAAGLAPAEAKVVRTAIAPLASSAAGGIPDERIARGLASWATLLGAVSLEVFGHLTNVVAPGQRTRRAFFEHQMREVAAGLGLG